MLIQQDVCSTGCSWSGPFLVSDFSMLSNYQHELINYFKCYCCKKLGCGGILLPIVSSEEAGLVLLEDKLGTSVFCGVWTDECVMVRCPSLSPQVISSSSLHSQAVQPRHWMTLQVHVQGK